MKQKLLFLVLLFSISKICLAQADLDAFLAIKNIFDPGRTELQAPKPTPTPKPAVEKLTLTGVLRSDKIEVAFFDGSRPEWSLPVEGGGIIAGMKLEKIDGSGATLSGKFLAVGASFSKVGDGAWGLAPEIQTHSAPPPAINAARRVASNQGRRSSFTVSSRGAAGSQASQAAKPEQDYEVTFPDLAKDWWEMTPPDESLDDQRVDP